MRGAWSGELKIKTSMRDLAPLAFMVKTSGNDSGKQIQMLMVQILVSTR